MSALNPLPSSGPSTEKRPYEPSMEEILASIRRIIADDQSLPGRGASVREPETRTDAPHVPMPRNETAPVDPVHEPRLTSEVPQAVVPQPAEESLPPQAPSDLEPQPADTSPIRWDVAEPPHELEPAHEVELESQSQPSAARSLAHGSINAPQYAAPDGRILDEHGGEWTQGEWHRPEGAADPQPPTSSRPLDDDLPRHTQPAEAFDEPIEPPLPHAPAPEMSPLFSSATDSSVASAFNVLAASRLAANSDEIMNLVKEMIRPLLRNWLDDNLPSMVERMVRDEIERVARGGR